MEVSLGRIGLSRTEYAQCCRDVRARAHGSVLEASLEARVDVFSQSCEERGVHVREAGEEAGLHR
jgi:hypothetical protein